MIFCSSFYEDIFPEQLKIAKVSPNFKFDNIEDVGNYRPISVLPIFSKVLERIMHNRNNQYFFKKMTCFSRNSLTFKGIIPHIMQF